MNWPPRHIAVAVDVDPLADRALAEHLVDDASTLAHQLKARVTLIFAAPPLVSPVGPPTDVVNDAYRAFLDIADARHKNAERQMDELVLRARGVGVEARPLMVSRNGALAQTIVDVAHEETADLLLFASHARRGLDRLLLGSVTERATHLARIPVMVLPPR